MVKINQGHAVLAVIGLIIAGIAGYGYMKKKSSPTIQENATTKVFPPPGTPFMNSAYTNASSPTSFGHKADGPGSGCGCSSKRGTIPV
jgi:LPXTG-motif cell wall-anchored protein